MIQVDTLCHKIPNFVEKAKRAGVTRVFIGLENINPDNLAGRQEAAEQDHRVSEDAARLEGRGHHHHRRLHPRLPGRHARRRSGATSPSCRRELPIDILEFFCLTPLPGSEDHQGLWKAGVAMDPDLNNYDVEHVCTAHPRMSRKEWEDIYQEAWSLYYSPAHMKVLLQRAAATGVPMKSLATAAPHSSRPRFALEGVHPAPGRHPSPEAPVRAAAGPAAGEAVAVLAALRPRHDPHPRGAGRDLCAAPAREQGHRPRSRAHAPTWTWR